jgi:hypothetical protein
MLLKHSQTLQLPLPLLLPGHCNAPATLRTLQLLLNGHCDAPASLLDAATAAIL